MSLTQQVTKAPFETKIRFALLCTALSDALGGPAEFHHRFSFPHVDSMIPNKNFNLPKGVWTDDTSMTLSLARSIASKNGFNEKDQLDAYTRWSRDGTLSATGECFDIGNTIGQAVGFYQANPSEEALLMVKKQLSGDGSSGNGSLMRIIPIGVAYWRDEDEAMALARRSSTTTHPNDMCQEACEVWTGAICRIMRAATDDNITMSKLDVLAYFARFHYRNADLRKALAYTGKELEAEHPLLVLIKASGGAIPKTKDLPSTGYVLHTLVAALYCFLATDSFEAGAIRAANLGSDADTVAAVYGGMAGCWYGNDGDSTFWTPKVAEWYGDLVKPEVIKEVSDELVALAKRLGQAA